MPKSEIHGHATKRTPITCSAADTAGYTSSVPTRSAPTEKRAKTAKRHGAWRRPSASTKTRSTIIASTAPAPLA